MNYTRKFTLTLDTLLLVISLVLLAPRFSGLRWHEWLGVAVVPPIVLHLLLSWSWIAGAFRRIFSSEGTWRGRVNLLLNLALFFFFVFEVVTGLMISQVSLPWFGFHMLDDSAWRILHNKITGQVRILLALHLAMNWKWVVTTIAGLARRARFALAAARWTSGWVGTSLRTIAIAAAMAAVAAFPFWLVGPPTKARLLHFNEVEMFRATLFPGVPNLAAQMLGMIIIAYVGHRWLRVRL